MITSKPRPPAFARAASAEVPPTNIEGCVGAEALCERQPLRPAVGDRDPLRRLSSAPASHAGCRSARRRRRARCRPARCRDAPARESRRRAARSARRRAGSVPASSGMTLPCAIAAAGIFRNSAKPPSSVMPSARASAQRLPLPDRHSRQCPQPVFGATMTGPVGSAGAHVAPGLDDLADDLMAGHAHRARRERGDACRRRCDDRCRRCRNG